jgi:hypothetical protein
LHLAASVFVTARSKQVLPYLAYRLAVIHGGKIAPHALFAAALSDPDAQPLGLCMDSKLISQAIFRDFPANTRGGQNCWPKSKPSRISGVQPFWT